MRFLYYYNYLKWHAHRGFCARNSHTLTLDRIRKGLCHGLTEIAISAVDSVMPSHTYTHTHCSVWNNNNNEFTHTWTKCEKLHLSFLSLYVRDYACVLHSRECSKIAHSCNVSICMQKAILFIWLHKIISHPWIDYYTAECENCVRASEWGRE